MDIVTVLRTATHAVATEIGEPGRPEFAAAQKNRPIVEKPLDTLAREWLLCTATMLHCNITSTH
jgi:hypothetical protein